MSKLTVDAGHHRGPQRAGHRRACSRRCARSPGDRRPQRHHRRRALRCWRRCELGSGRCEWRGRSGPGGVVGQGAGAGSGGQFVGGPTGGAGVRGTDAGGAGVGVAGFGTPGGSGAGVYGVGSGGSAGGQFVSGAGGPALALSHAAQPAYRGHISFAPVSQAATATAGRGSVVRRRQLEDSHRWRGADDRVRLRTTERWFRLLHSAVWLDVEPDSN